jgi:hypothetical protein
LRHNGEIMRHAVTERINSKGSKSQGGSEGGRSERAYRAMLDRKMDDMLAKAIAAAKVRRQKKREKR